MKKIASIFLLCILALFVISGCQNSSVQNNPSEKTQQIAENSITGQTIEDTTNLSDSLDTTQVDNDLNGASQSLDNW